MITVIMDSKLASSCFRINSELHRIQLDAWIGFWSWYQNYFGNDMPKHIMKLTYKTHKITSKYLLKTDPTAFNVH